MFTLFGARCARRHVPVTRYTVDQSSVIANALPKSQELKERFQTAHIRDVAEYNRLYSESIRDPEAFWSSLAQKHLSWFSPYDEVTSGSLKTGNIVWFTGGTLNAAYNALDRHLPTRANQPAIIWEADEPGNGRTITYQELHEEVCKFSNALLRAGITPGQVVTICMPMIPEAVIAMLGCARVGVVHNVVFAGFSAHALETRIVASKSVAVVTANEGVRGGKSIPLKSIVDEALEGETHVKKVIVFQRNQHEPKWHAGRDIWWHDFVKGQKPYCPPKRMDSEDPLFILYTSGSTGQPKGVEHTTAGYLLYAMVSHKWVFDLHEGDVWGCMADIGWITGHSYICYGPLLNGSTTVMFESIPTYPSASRYWQVIEKYKITHFYTAPTAIRALMKYGTEPLEGYDLSSVRVLGTVGEPINPAAWMWYYQHVGKERCPIVDTYWQTETGGVIVSPLPGLDEPMKPGKAIKPFFGIDLQLLDEGNGAELVGNDKKGILAVKSTWPGMMRTVYNDHDRFLSTYLGVYPGYYLTGDCAYRDSDGDYQILGRIDDVINKAGHRLGTAEIESALVATIICIESAVISVPHEVFGEAIWAFCIIREQEGAHSDLEIVKILKKSVAEEIGKIAIPDKIVLTSALPKTRSGKIMRRLLKNIALGKTEAKDLGDVSTLADPQVLTTLLQTKAF